jgi:hypothetical protein
LGGNSLGLGLTWTTLATLGLDFVSLTGFLATLGYSTGLGFGDLLGAVYAGTSWPE